MANTRLEMIEGTILNKGSALAKKEVPKGSASAKVEMPIKKESADSKKKASK